MVEPTGFEPLPWRADFSFALQPDKPLLNLRVQRLFKGTGVGKNKIR